MKKMNVFCNMMTVAGVDRSAPGANSFFKFISSFKNQSVAVATLAMTFLPTFKSATFFGLVGTATGIALVTSCKEEREPEPEPEPKKPEPEPDPEPEPEPEPEDPVVKLDTVYHNINTVAYLTDSIAVMERQATGDSDSLTRLDITLGTLALSEGQFDAVAESLNKLRTVARSERVIRFDSTAFAIAPATAGILITYDDWENLGFPPIAIGAGGIKFDILANEADKFAVYRDVLNIRPGGAAEVTIEGPNDFAEKVKKIEEFHRDGFDTVHVTVLSDIPTTNAVMNILNQKTVTGGNVTWIGDGAFVPNSANQELDGRLFEHLPVGSNSDKRFYVPGKNYAHLLGDLRGLVWTDTLSTSRFPTFLRGNEKIFVNTDYAVDARNFSGYERTNDMKKHIPVIVQEGKKLVFINATTDILACFQTDEARKAYNDGYTGSRPYGWTSPTTWHNTNFGSNGPLQLLSHEYQFFEALQQYINYDNIFINSMKVGKDDEIHEVGHFETINGETIDVSNCAFNMLEWSRLNAGPIDFIIEGNKINIGWSQLPTTTFPSNHWILNKGSPIGWKFVDFVSKELFRLKEYGVTMTVTDDWCIITPSEATVFNYNGSYQAQPSPDVKKYMMDEFNIDLVPRQAPSTYNAYPFKAYSWVWRVPGGWESASGESR